MEKEITDAERCDDRNAEFHKKYAGAGRLGMDCDRADWLRLRMTIRREIERRSEE